MHNTKWEKSVQDKLVEAVQQNTKNSRVNWKNVSAIVGRSPNQCKTFYRNILKKDKIPKVNQYFTNQEEMMIFKFVCIYGKQWDLLQKTLLPHRSALSIRLKYNYMERKDKKLCSLIKQLIDTQTFHEEELKQLTKQQKIECRKQIIMYNDYINKTGKVLSESQQCLNSGFDPLDVAFYKKYYDPQEIEVLNKILDYINNETNQETK